MQHEPGVFRVTPITTEAEWTIWLRDLPLWNPSPRHLFVVAPHPDDEVLGAGGLIAGHSRSGLRVTVIAVTDGEAAYPEMPGLAETRRFEQEQALAVIGVPPGNIVRLKMHDGNVAAHEADLVRELVRLVDGDSLIAAPWVFDSHPDHEACGRAAALAAEIAGCSLLSYFFWTWHRFRPHALEELKPRRFDLDANLQNAKAQALAQYRSQLQRKEGDPILPASLLAPARRSFETFVIHEP